MTKLNRIAAALALCGAIGASQAGIVVTISESATGVSLAYGAGTLDTTGLTIHGNYGGCGALFTGVAALLGGGPAGSCTGFSGGITVSKSAGWTLGTGTSAWSAFQGAGALIASENYNSLVSIFIGNDPAAAIVGMNQISGASGTVNGASFASTGLTDGQFIEFSWGSDSLRFTTGAASTDLPEPASLALVGAALAGLARVRRKRA